jgi:peptide chain release factor 2
MSLRCGGIFDVDRREKIFAELEAKAASPDFWNETNKAKATIEETNAHKAVLEPFRRVLKKLEERCSAPQVKRPVSG